MIKLAITTHSGKEYRAEVAEYVPVRINDDLNNNAVNTVVFGEVIVSRIDVKSVVKIAEDATVLTD